MDSPGAIFRETSLSIVHQWLGKNEYFSFSIESVTLTVLIAIFSGPVPEPLDRPGGWTYALAESQDCPIWT